MSTPGWIKIENGQRQASEKLLEKLVKWLVGDKYMKSGAATTLREELLTLKYLGSRSRLRARDGQEARQEPAQRHRLLHEDPPGYRAKPQRGRPGRTACRDFLPLRARVGTLGVRVLNY